MSMEDRQDPTTSAQEKDRVVHRDDETDDVEAHGPRTVRRPLHNADDSGEDDVEGHTKQH
jgi:hypothetical protein